MTMEAPIAETARGFTLLEMLVVLTIVGLLLASVHGGLVDTIPSQRLHKDASDIAGALEKTRDDAVTEGMAVDVVFDLRQGRYWPPPNGEAVALPPGTSLDLKDIPRTLLQDHMARIEFLSDGSSSGGEVVLSRGAKRFEIEVDWLTGQVSLHD